jgi:GNAT superfamily N-acetyltransferase
VRGHALAELGAEPQEAPTVLVCRGMREDEHGFVIDAWIKAYSESRWAVQRGPRFWKDQERIIRWCMGRGRVLVATTEDSPDAALGFICGVREPATIDWLYCKPSARRLGVASGLVQALAGVPWREWQPRMTHRSNREKLRAMVAPVGWRYAEITEQEMGL